MAKSISLVLLLLTIIFVNAAEADNQTLEELQREQICERVENNSVNPANQQQVLQQQRAQTTTCTCRYTRVNNNWGDVELVRLANGVRSREWHRNFPPNFSDGAMTATCQTMNRDLVTSGRCPEILVERY